MSVHIRIRYPNNKPTFQKIFNIVESKQAKKKKKRKRIQHLKNHHLENYNHPQPRNNNF